ncbi:hypothetical protein F4820DRAFT_470071 [Hypoxylon rubiginosum]|uniref:Uncharacterized protein n=1 Tax=Hypoxylon rubiginosum TaxID=110542 RepID=A0ACB9Z164_9PEZI|nr:hypothetical protein F4820DRAFT_470071 [Hypoxylon rubiginosum]
MSRQLFYGSQVTPPIIGRANVVLFLVNSEAGLSNVLVATAKSLLEEHPAVEIHFASFAPLAPQLERISSYIHTKDPSNPAQDVVFHQLPDLSWTRAIKLSGRTMSNMAHPPGLDGISQICKDIQFYVSPWSGEDHYVLYQRLIDIIDQVDPAIIVLDTVFRPGIDATRERNRLHASISPNTLIDNFVMEQPYGSMFWKYPLIPENIYLTLRFIYSVLSMSDIKKKQAFLKSKGLSDPINFYNLHRPDVPWFTQTLPGASRPLYKVPQNVSCLGPMSISLGEASGQDLNMVNWLARKPTILAAAMASALAHVLEQTDLQVLWKFRKDTTDPFDNVDRGVEYDDAFITPLQPFINSGRVKMTPWLSVDPTALLKTGHIAVSVHHGGAGCYHEAIEAGVPQLVLPQWFDLYNFAQLVQDIGVGVWGCPETSPDWTIKCLEGALLRVVKDKSGQEMKENARHLEHMAQNSPGPQFAASEIARLAAAGKSERT